MADIEARHIEQSKLARNALIVSGATLGSRLFGFIRDCLFAALLGAGPFADAFFVAFRVPNLFRRLFGEGAFALAVMGEYSMLRQHRGGEAAFAFIRACGVLFLPILSVVLFLGWCYAGKLATLLAPGFAFEPELVVLTAGYLRFVLPYCLMICGVALCGVILNAEGHFATPALAPLVLNISLILFGCVGWFCGFPVPESFCAGLLAGGFIQLAMQFAPLRKADFSLWGEWRPAWRQAVVSGLRLFPVILGAASFQLTLLLLTFLASFLAEGSISYLSYADRLMQFPLGVFAIAVGTAALPELSTLAAKGDNTAFRNTLRRALSLTAFISFPAAAGLAGMAHPVTELLFARGAFGANDVIATAHALQGFAVGIPSLAMLRPMLAACHARKDVRSPVVAGVAGILVSLLVGILLMRDVGHVGLAVGAGVGSWVNMVILLRLFRHREGVNLSTLYPFGLYIILSAFVLVASLWGASCGMWSILSIPFIILSYAIMAHIAGSPDTRVVLGTIVLKERN